MKNKFDVEKGKFEYGKKAVLRRPVTEKEVFGG